MFQIILKSINKYRNSSKDNLTEGQGGKNTHTLTNIHQSDYVSQQGAM